MSLRPSQLTLRLDPAAPAQSQRWQDGAVLAFLGGTLTLCLDTGVASAQRIGDELHLPLPPHASDRQVQDSAEAWLRREAELRFADVLARHSQTTGQLAPRLQLSFATRGGWTDVEPPQRGTRSHAGRIKCNWRLIEQSPETIEQTLIHALTALQTNAATPDLFGGLFAA